MIKKNNIITKKFATIFTVINLTLYWLCSYGLMLLQKCHIRDVVLFSIPNFCNNPLLINILSAIVFLSGFFMLFFILGWLILLYLKKSQDLAILSGSSFTLSILLAIIISTLFKTFTHTPLNHLNFSLLISSFITTELFFLWILNPTPVTLSGTKFFDKTFMIVSLTLIVITLSFISYFHQKILNTNVFNISFTQEAIRSIPLGEQTDLLERFGLAKSLNTHLLPFWDLEYADKFGYVFTDPPLCAFIQSFSFLMFGETLASLILVPLCLMMILFIIITSYKQKNIFMRLFINSIIFISFILFFKGNLDEFAEMTPLLLFFSVISYMYLLAGKHFMFLIFSLTATLTQFYGVFFTLIGLISYSVFFKDQRNECKNIFTKYIYILIGIAAFVLSIGLMEGNVEIYFKTFLIEHFARLDLFQMLDKIYPEFIVENPPFRFVSRLNIINWCLVSTGCFFPLLLFFGKNKEENFYSLIILTYFFLIFISRYTLGRYIIPIIPITAIVASSKITRIRLMTKKYQNAK